MSEGPVEPKVETLPAPRPVKRRNWLIALLMAVVFLSGIICGGGATAVFMVRRVRQAVQHPEERPGRNLGWIARRLDLTPEQRREVHEIIQRHNKETQRLRESVMPRVRAEMKSLEEEIAAVLTPEQERQWRELAARARRDWMPPAEGQGQGGGPGPRQGPGPDERPRRGMPGWQGPRR
jgi:Spy/CpxP family protein refolding chaperone